MCMESLKERIEEHDAKYSCAFCKRRTGDSYVLRVITDEEIKVCYECDAHAYETV